MQEDGVRRVRITGRGGGDSATSWFLFHETRKMNVFHHYQNASSKYCRVKYWLILKLYRQLNGFSQTFAWSDVIVSKVSPELLLGYCKICENRAVSRAQTITRQLLTRNKWEEKYIRFVLFSRVFRQLSNIWFQDRFQVDKFYTNSHIYKT